MPGTTEKDFTPQILVLCQDSCDESKTDVISGRREFANFLVQQKIVGSLSDDPFSITNGMSTRIIRIPNNRLSCWALKRTKNTFEMVGLVP